MGMSLSDSREYFLTYPADIEGEQGEIQHLEACATIDGK